MSFGDPDGRTSRCAIYTRKSVKHGLDLEQNSLEVQREICSAYIHSQRHKRWLEMPTRYDDGGYSGGSLERPAMAQLLADVEAGLVDVIVVYKLDRLTRSLADFIRLIDVLEVNGVTFVSVTQSFDTQDSMGRLVLNVLLTFAQFEREMIADRVRDKMAQMKKAGRWTGGAPPYGYDLIDGRLVVNAAEAVEVRALFERYLELESSNLLTEECRRMGMTTKRRLTLAGRPVGGTPVSRGQIYWMLGNPAYIAAFRVQGELIAGIHEPIVERELWDRVQMLRDARRLKQIPDKPYRHLLLGMAYDEFGRKMRVAFDQKKGRNYRYYYSDSNDARTKRGLKLLRAAGDTLEELVLTGIGTFLRDRFALSGAIHSLGRRTSETDRLVDHGPNAANLLTQLDRKQLRMVCERLIDRVEISRERLRIILSVSQVAALLSWRGTGVIRDKADGASSHVVHVLELDAVAVRHERTFQLGTDARPERSGEPDRKLVQLLRSARHVQQIVFDRRDLTMKQVAAGVKRTPAYAARLLRLNYLAPDIVAAIMDGRQPPALDRRTLLFKSLPTDWVQQRAMLGFPVHCDRSPREKPY